jgi:hypothetical protein
MDVHEVAEFGAASVYRGEAPRRFENSRIRRGYVEATSAHSTPHISTGSPAPERGEHHGDDGDARR